MGGGGSSEIPETEAEKAQAHIAQKRWADYENNFRPYEDMFMGRVDQMNSEQELNRASELAMTPLSRSFAREGVKISKMMQSNGVNPNSGKYKSAMGDVETSLANEKVNASSRAVSSQQDRYVSGLKNIVAMGQGQAGEAIAGMTDIASMSQKNAQNDALNDLQSRQNVQGAVGTAVGGGLRWGQEQYGSNDKGQG